MTRRNEEAETHGTAAAPVIPPFGRLMAARSAITGVASPFLIASILFGETDTSSPRLTVP